MWKSKEMRKDKRKQLGCRQITCRYSILLRNLYQNTNLNVQVHYFLTKHLHISIFTILISSGPLEIRGTSKLSTVHET